MVTKKKVTKKPVKPEIAVVKVKKPTLAQQVADNVEKLMNRDAQITSLNNELQSYYIKINQLSEELVKKDFLIADYKTALDISNNICLEHENNTHTLKVTNGNLNNTIIGLGQQLLTTKKYYTKQVADLNSERETLYREFEKSRQRVSFYEHQASRRLHKIADWINYYFFDRYF